MKGFLSSRLRAFTRITLLFPAILAMALARLIAADGAKAKEIDSSDALFKREDVPLIRIEIPEAGMEALRSYEFRKGSNPDERTNVAATIRADGQVFTNVAVHLKGSLGSFRPVDDRPALTVNFEKWVEGQRYHGLKKISLNNSVQDPSYASEIVSRQLFRAAGLPCPRATHARVDLNGRDLGLYVLLEGWNKQFLKRHFPDARGNLWDSGSAGDIMEDLDVSSSDGRNDRQLLDQLIEAARVESLADRVEQLGKVLDLDRFLTLIAMEVMLVHWDGYAMNKNNYRVFHDRSVDRLVFLPQGMDQMFGQYRHRPESSIKPMMRGLVARNVMQVPSNNRRYLERMEQLLDGIYRVSELTNQVDAISAKLQPVMGQNLAMRSRQMMAAAALKDRIIRRAASVRQQLVTAFTPLDFGSSGEVYLTDWKNSRESGSPSYSRKAVPVPTLEITARGSRTYASWRTEVFLAEGEYRFEGRVKIVGAVYGPELERPGVTVRVSGDREAVMRREAMDWQVISNDIKVVGTETLELVCEFRASGGTAVFDLSSLKLVRKSSPE